MVFFLEGCSEAGDQTLSGRFVFEITSGVDLKVESGFSYSQRVSKKEREKEMEKERERK